MRLEFTLHQAEQLLAMFGGDPSTTITVSLEPEGHSGPGLYGHHTEYPDEGSVQLGPCASCDPDAEGIVCTCELPVQPSEVQSLIRALQGYGWDCHRQTEIEPGLWRDCGSCSACRVRKAMLTLAAPPACGHSACRQNWVDTGAIGCVQPRHARRIG